MVEEHRSETPPAGWSYRWTTELHGDDAGYTVTHAVDGYDSLVCPETCNADAQAHEEMEREFRNFASALDRSMTRDGEAQSC